LKGFQAASKFMARTRDTRRPTPTPEEAKAGD
jgi:hypothetical protein